MTKSATDVMQEIIFSAAIDSIMALKTASKGLPNTLLRDLNAIHANTTFADLPPEVQAAITTSVRAAFTRLLKEGYSVSSGSAATRNPSPRRDPGSPPRGPGRSPSRPGGDTRKPPRSNRRPNRNPKPRDA